jgi:chromosome segregation ATPase
MAEVQADKDLLRAEYAMSTRRLEVRVEEIKAKTTSHLMEIGKKSETISRLKLELAEKTAALFALEAKDKQLADHLERIEADLAVKAGALEEMERTLASKEAELAKVRANLPRSLVAADSKRSRLSRQKNSMRALLSVLEEQWKGTHLMGPSNLGPDPQITLGQRHIPQQQAGYMTAPRKVHERLELT